MHMVTPASRMSFFEWRPSRLGARGGIIATRHGVTRIWLAKMWPQTGPAGMLVSDGELWNSDVFTNWLWVRWEWSIRPSISLEERKTVPSRDICGTAWTQMRKINLMTCRFCAYWGQMLCLVHITLTGNDKEADNVFIDLRWKQIINRVQVKTLNDLGFRWEVLFELLVSFVLVQTRQDNMVEGFLQSIHRMQ